MATQLDCYGILQVHPKAEKEVIDAAYRRLASKYHPDVSQASDASERIKQINTACTYDGICLLQEVIEKTGTLEPEPLIVELEKIDYRGAFGRIKFTPRGFLQVGDEIPHDLMWGPEYTTTVAIQWQDGEPHQSSLGVCLHPSK